MASLIFWQVNRFQSNTLLCEALFFGHMIETSEHRQVECWDTHTENEQEMTAVVDETGNGGDVLWDTFKLSYLVSVNPLGEGNWMQTRLENKC